LTTKSNPIIAMKKHLDPASLIGTVLQPQNPLPITKLIRCLPVASSFAVAMVAAPASAAIITGTYHDAVWSHSPEQGLPGNHRVAASAYDYWKEQYELPVQASGWNYDGNPAATSGTWIHSGRVGAVGKYWAFADLSKARADRRQPILELQNLRGWRL